MIYGTDNHVGRLIALERSKFRFYLTGSRYFGVFNACSDFDFFTEDSKEVRDFLSNMGLKEVKSRYTDKLTTAVYISPSIDVQICRDVQLKQKVQEKFRSIGCNPTKQDWELAYALLA